MLCVESLSWSIHATELEMRITLGHEYSFYNTKLSSSVAQWVEHSACHAEYSGFPFLLLAKM